MTTTSPLKRGWCFRKVPTVTRVPDTKRSVVAVTRQIFARRNVIGLLP